MMQYLLEIFLIKIYSSQFFHELEYIKELLNKENIFSEIRNIHLTNLFGQLPYEDTLLTLWVHENDGKDAVDIINEFKSTTDSSKKLSLICPNCSEKIDRTLKICLNCKIKD